MADAPVDYEADLNSIEGLPAVPVCPICTNLLASAEAGYKYARLNPDTRWFFCADCETHVGYHRMKATWRIDPYDYTNNDKLRERIGLPPAGE